MKIYESQILAETHNLTLLAVGKAYHDADWNFGPVNSIFTRIYYVNQGEAIVQIDNIEHELKAGYMYIIPPFVTHIDKCQGLFDHYYLHFYDPRQRILNLYARYRLPFGVWGKASDRMLFEDLCRDCPEMALTDSRPSFYETDTQLKAVTENYEAYADAKRIQVHATILLLLSKFLAQSESNDTISDERIKRIIKIIDKNIGESLSIDELASKISLGKDRFIRLFKAETGETPGVYIMRHKIRQAQLMLTTSDKRIKEIAYELGFASESYFDREFRYHVHLSPTDFRTQNLNLV